MPGLYHRRGFLRCGAAFGLAATASARGGIALSAEQPAAKTARPKVTLSKETTFFTKPLTPDGYVDYLGVLNEIASDGVTPENNAAVLLWQAFGPSEIKPKVRSSFFKRLGIPPLPETGGYFVTLTKFERSKETDDDEDLWKKQLDREQQAMNRPWSKEEFPELSSWLDGNEKPLGIAVEATKRPRYYSPLLTAGESTPLLTVELPDIRNLRDLARALRMRAMRSTKAGRIEEAWQDLVVCHRLAHLVHQMPMLIYFLVGIALSGIACSGEAAFAHHSNLNIEKARRCLGDLGNLPPAKPLHDALRLGERCFALDLVSCVSRNDSNALSMLCAAFDGKTEELKSALSAVLLKDVEWDEALRVVNRWFDLLLQVLKPSKPSERKSTLQEFENKLRKSADNQKGSLGRLGAASQLDIGASRSRGQAIGDIAAAILMSTYKAAIDVSQREAVFNSFARVALTLACYRAEHGEYPDTLAALTPTYSPEMPKDAFSDTPLRYKKQGKGYLLYSVGPNGKDEGGRDLSDDPSGQPAPPDDIVIRLPLE